MLEGANKENSKYMIKEFTYGIKEGIPIAIGYIPIAITFGLISKSSGVPGFASISMSIFIYAGASQFIGVNLMAMGASTMEIVMTTLILNFRHFLMTSSLSQRIEEKATKKMLSVIAFGVTDESFAVLSLRKEEKINVWFAVGLNSVAYLSWVIGTSIGIIIGDAIPKILSSSMGIALYAMFIGLLIPSLKKSRPILIVSMISIIVSGLLQWIPIFSFISKGWSIIVSTVIAAAAGAVLYQREVEQHG